MRSYLIFFTASLSIFMTAIDATVVAVAFPNFTRELHSNVLWSAWTISIYFIAVTMAMPLAGNLSDSFGRKKVFLFSLLLFTGSSLACGLAPTIYALIAFRFLQGIGGACFLPTASGIVSDHFPEGREAAIGLFASIFGLGAVVGPNLGGWIVSEYSWRYIFYINVPIGVLLTGSTMMLLKESGTVANPQIDFAGVALMSGSLLLFMLGLNFVAESFSTPSILLTVLLVLVSLLLTFLFLRQEKRAAKPIIDAALLESKAFAAANASNLVVGMTTIGIFSFVPLYAISVHKLSTLMSGMILTPRSLAMAIAAAATSFLLRRFGYRWPMVIGFAITGLTIILLAPGLFPSNAAGAWLGILGTLSIVLFLNGIGSGMVFPASNNACIELMPEKVGTIVGLRNMFRNIGGALAISLVTFILHLSPDSASGFMIAFIVFGLMSLASIPLLFLMPAGRRAWGQGSSYAA
jgi:EmrB/QacA subfamily drug resistance transporter